MKNAVYFQSGGPTAVINASFWGVISACKQCNQIGTLYGSKYGISGLIKDDLVQIDKDLAYYDELQYINGAILGTVRKQLKDNDEALPLIAQTCKKHNIGYVFANGGNDSMDTADKLNKYFASINLDCVVVGIPKTIDNDLALTHHCPGFGSSVKYVVSTVQQLFLDINSYNPGRVTVVEMMGRDTGWITASSVGANVNGLGPDLIYLPEHPFDKQQFLQDVQRIWKQRGRVLVCVAEALKDADGNYVSTESGLDSFGHVQLGSVSKYLTQLVENNLGYKTRNAELGLCQRCAGNLQSKVDRQEAIEVGKKAVEYALQGKRGMVAIQLVSSNPYEVKYDLVPLGEVANKIKYLPKQYVNERGNYVTDSFVDYIRPFLDEEEILIKSGLMFLK